MTFSKTQATPSCLHLARIVDGKITTACMVGLLWLGFTTGVQAAVLAPTTDLLIGLDGSDTTTSGSAVSSWNDQIAAGGSENFTDLSNAAQRPTLISQTLPNGSTHNVVDFDGSTGNLGLGADTSLDSLTGSSWFMVIRMDTNTGVDYIFANGDSTDGNDRWASIGFSDEFGYATRTTSQQFSLPGEDVTFSRWYLLSSEDAFATGGNAGNHFRLFDVDNTNTASPLADGDGNLAGQALGTHAGSALGGLVGGTGTFDGAIAEFLLYDVRLGTTERAAAEQYLLDKYFLGSFGGSSVPEPGSLTLLALGACWLVSVRRRRRKV